MLKHLHRKQPQVGQYSGQRSIKADNCQLFRVADRRAHFCQTAQDTARWVWVWPAFLMIREQADVRAAALTGIHAACLTPKQPRNAEERAPRKLLVMPAYDAKLLEQQ